MSHLDTLKSYLPWIQPPLIINAPMARFAGPSLATAVTKSYGLGQIGTLNEAATLEKQLSEIQTNLSSDSTFKSQTDTLPIGVGLLLFQGKLDTVLPVLTKYQPAVIWLFAAVKLADYKEWAGALRAASPSSKIWIQTGSVTAALYLAEHAQPDALIVQGADAGGHGYEKGAGIVTVLPEVIDALAANGFEHLPVLASGGVVDGRGVAAVLALGASGVVMGTRFLSATETEVHPKYQEQIIRARDGGQSTVRAKVFDELKGPNTWPAEYDGRGLVTQSYSDHLDGVDIDQIRKLHSEAVDKEHAGFGEGHDGRAVIWAGTGVGLVKQRQSAKEVIDEVRGVTRKTFNAVTARL